ncbi:MAG TPA: hypothetical protein VLA85_16950, partial [Verrucomicrobiae bacterium]|nr:hypothetical protein [Verrucomicrobiae bacterium]
MIRLAVRGFGKENAAQYRGADQPAGGGLWDVTTDYSLGISEEMKERRLAVAPPGHFRQMLAGAIGNSLEWYDFAAYGYFAAIFGRNFFPASDAVVSLASAFGVFAA